MIWCSRIAIAARAVASSYVSPKPVAWLRHSRSACDVPSPGVMSVGTLRSAPTPGGEPVDRPGPAGHPQVLVRGRDPLHRRRGQLHRRRAALLGPRDEVVQRQRGGRHGSSSFGRRARTAVWDQSAAPGRRGAAVRAQSMGRTPGSSMDPGRATRPQGAAAQRRGRAASPGSPNSVCTPSLNATWSGSPPRQVAEPDRAHQPVVEAQQLGVAQRPRRVRVRHVQGPAPPPHVQPPPGAQEVVEPGALARRAGADHDVARGPRPRPAQPGLVGVHVAVDRVPHPGPPVGQPEGRAGTGDDDGAVRVQAEEDDPAATGGVDGVQPHVGLQERAGPRHARPARRARRRPSGTAPARRTSRPSRTSGRTPGGTRCRTRSGSTAQCTRVRSRQSWFIITGPRSRGASTLTGSTSLTSPG